MRKLFAIFVLLMALVPVLAHADNTTLGGDKAADVVNSNLPTVPGGIDVNPGNAPMAIVYNFYLIALWLGGALAFGSIVFAGIQYLSARGSTEAVSGAKGRLQNAVLGLLLLLGMYILLALINPDLTRLRLPTMEKIPEAKLQGPMGQQGYEPNADVWACKSGDGNIKACFATEDACNQGCDTIADPSTGTGGTESCAKVKGKACNDALNLIPPGQCATGKCVAIGLPWEYKNGSQADPKMVQELQCLAGKGVTLRITEAMPPSSPHKSKKHTNGCAVDATIPAVSTAADCSKICDIKSKVESCGGTMLNEYFNLCKSASCKGVNTELATADHVHINAACGL